MVADIVLATLTGVAACAEFIHRQCQRLVCLDAQGSK